MKKFLALALITGNILFIFVSFFLILTTDYIKDIEVLGIMLLLNVVAVFIVLILGSALDRIDYENRELFQNEFTNFK